MRRTHVDAIDGLRAFAVLAVVGFHTVLHAVAGPAPAWAGCGARGVDLFFVISGFCLAYPYLRAFRATGALEIGYGRFFVRRLVRIAPPYWIALLLFAALSLTAFGLPTAPWAHPGSPQALRELGLDAAFLTNASPAYDASFWTLGIEMRWYLLFPLLLRLYARSRLAFFALGAAAYASYFFSPWPISDEGTLPCFMFGIVAADLRLTRPAWRRFAPAAAALALGAAVWSQARTLEIDHGDPRWHLAAFLLVVASEAAPFERILRAAPLAFTGAASYSLYLVHQPVLDGLAFAGAGPALATAAALGAGFAFYAAVERPLLDARFRRPVEAALGRLVPATTSS
jgi:peptidoglycan/LPS O-acetylase OafA/YrhL